MNRNILNGLERSVMLGKNVSIVLHLGRRKSSPSSLETMATRGTSIRAGTLLEIPRITRGRIYASVVRLKRPRTVRLARPKPAFRCRVLFEARSAHDTTALITGA